MYTIKLSIFPLALILLVLVLLSSSTVAAQEADDVQIRRAALERVATLQLEPNVGFEDFEVDTIRQEGGWASLNLTSFPLGEPEADSHGVIPDVMLALAQKDEGVWRVRLDIEPEFKLFLQAIPDSLISAESKALLLNTPSRFAEKQPTYAILGLPWAVGTSWRYNQGPHGGSQDAYDFGTPTAGVAALVTAAEQGTVTYIGDTCLTVTRPGDSLRQTYQHIRPSDIDNWSLNDPVSFGQPIGLTTVTFGCMGTTSGHHVHFYFDFFGQPVDSEGSTMNGWLASGNQLIREGVVANPNQADTLLHRQQCCGCALVARGQGSGSADVPFALFGEDGLMSRPNAVVAEAEPVQYAPECVVERAEVVTAEAEIAEPFSWSAATDQDGTVIGYHVYWGDDPDGESELFLEEPHFLPDEVLTDGEPATRYLRVAAVDDDGNVSAWQTAVVWQYDPVAPTGTLQVGNGGAVVSALDVAVRLAVEDAGSGVSEMRLSADGEVWGAWEAFAPSRAWRLADVAVPQTVYAQVRDVAGNMSDVMTASVTVDLSDDPPSSANYTVNCGTLTQGGVTKSSANYTVRGTIGQIHETTQRTSANYQVNSGFWACASAGGSVPTAVGTNMVAVESNRQLLLVVATTLIGLMVVIGLWRRRIVD